MSYPVKGPVCMFYMAQSRSSLCSYCSMLQGYVHTGVRASWSYYGSICINHPKCEWAPRLGQTWLNTSRGVVCLTWSHVYLLSAIQWSLTRSHRKTTLLEVLQGTNMIKVPLVYIQNVKTVNISMVRYEGLALQVQSLEL